MAYNLIAMAFNQIAMASNLLRQCLLVLLAIVFGVINYVPLWALGAYKRGTGLFSVWCFACLSTKLRNQIIKPKKLLVG